MKVVIFGPTGSAGGSVLRTCLGANAVAEVRTIARRPLGMDHPKLRTVVHGDFLDLSGIDSVLAGVDACLFCLGKSATQVSGEAEYRTITYEYALAAARAMRTASPGAAFHFISGRGTSLSSRFMWARVKAETERELLARAEAVCWRPAFIDGEPSRSAPRLVQVVKPLFRVLQPFRSLYIAGADIGRAMLQATVEGMRSRVIENPEIRAIADRASL